MSAQAVQSQKDVDSIQELQQFIIQGYIQINPTTTQQTFDAATIHTNILNEPMITPNPLYHSLPTPGGLAAGNNLLHVAPNELMNTSFLQSPQLISTLSNLLGTDYRIHPHSRTHLRQPGAATTMWHIDIHKGAWISPRSHTTNYLILSYYPQDTTLAMGPTELLPGTQYYRCDHDLSNFNRGSYPNLNDQLNYWSTKPIQLTCKAGTIMIMHYDLWHRALKCMEKDTSRLMLKFVAYRTHLPSMQQARSTIDLPSIPSIPSFPLAFNTNLSYETLCDSSCLDFLKVDTTTNATSILPSPPTPIDPLLIDVFSNQVTAVQFMASVRTNVLLLQTTNEWILNIQHQLFKNSSMKKIERIGIDLMFKYLMQTTISMFLKQKILHNSQIKCLVPYLKQRLLPTILQTIIEKARIMKFVKNRQLIWQHVWKWHFGFSLNNNDGNESNEGNDGKANDMCQTGAIECKTTEKVIIDDVLLQELNELKKQAICKYEPERLEASYKLASSKNGTEILLSIMIDKNTVKTSVRRTTYYGLLSSNYITAERLKKLITQINAASAATAADASPFTVAAAANSTDDNDGTVISAAAATTATTATTTDTFTATTTNDDDDDDLWKLEKQIMDKKRNRISPPIIRSMDGFDAESLLISIQKNDEIVYLLQKIIMNKYNQKKNTDIKYILDLASTLINDTENTENTKDTSKVTTHETATTPGNSTIASNRVAIDTLGYIFSNQLNETNTIATLGKYIDTTKRCHDGGVRVLASKSLAMLASNCYRSMSLTQLIGTILPVVIHGYRNDTDRYVRCHCTEILICYLSGCNPKDFEVTMDGKDASLALQVRKVLSTSVSENVIDTFVESVVMNKNSENYKDIQIFIRDLICQRKCPLTNAENPW